MIPTSNQSKNQRGFARQSTRKALLSMSAVVIIGAVASGLIAPSPSFAGIVDGQVTPADGYTETFDLSFTISGMMGDTLGTIGGGKLWQGMDGAGNLFFAFRPPKEFVDNSYGVNAAGWGKVTTEVDMMGEVKVKTKHTFDKLLGSDNVTFTVFGDDGTAEGTELLEFKIDYIAEFDDGAAYMSAGVADKNAVLPKGTVTDKADGDPGIALSVVPEAETSLAHNLATFGFSAGGLDLLVDSPAVLRDGDFDPILDGNGNYQAIDPLFADWEFAEIYEVKVLASVFADHAFMKVLPTDSHASPAKTAGDSLTDPNPTPVVIPLPAAVWAGMALLAALGGNGLLKRRRAAVA